MATNDTKRYYWLKLHKDFFKKHEIKIVEGMPNGKDYVLFYLKLLVESVSHEGDLRFSDTVPYNEQMLSILTDTNIDVVRSAMKIFTDLKMIDVLDDATIHMAEVQKLIGSETGAAQRKREYRGTNGGQLGDNVPKRLEIRDKIYSGGGNSSDTYKVSQDCKNRYLSNTDNSSNQLDINNKDKTTTATTVVMEEYEKNIGKATPAIEKRIKALVEEVGDKTVMDAIEEAAAMNIRNYKYMAAIARGHKGKKKERQIEPGDKGYKHIDPNCPECNGTGEAVRYIDGRADMPMKIDCPICCRH